ncbi:6825_t:CDS:2, partial [Cetraspora pellucida]
MTWCGIQGIERISSSCFKGIFTAEHIFEVISGLTSLQISDSWLNASNQLAIDGVNYNVPPITIICGHRNVGKSTFARYLLNNMLNLYGIDSLLDDLHDNNCPKVAYIESDVGQSEFTPSGPVSLNILNSPIFGLPFTHIQQAYGSYYVGSNTPFDDPDYYMHVDEEVQRIQLKISRLNILVNLIGMGYDLFLRIFDFTRPTHLFQFYLSIHSYQNLPPFPTSVVSPPNEDPPKIALVDPSEISTKYTSADHQNTKWWQFDKPLIHHSRWCLGWTKGLTKGVFVFSGDVPWSQLLYVLNDSIVGLVGSILDVDESFEIVDESETSQEKGISIQPSRYFPFPDYPPPDPSEYTFLGLAIIRSIDPFAHTFHMLTPLSYVELQKISLIVKGTLDLPTCFMLDSNNISTGVCGVPWKRVPYMNLEAREGVGNAAQRVRKR